VRVGDTSRSAVARDVVNGPSGCVDEGRCYDARRMSNAPRNASFLAMLVLLAACGSSAPYASPGRVAGAAGVAAAGAAASRATGACLAMCTNGTHCNAVTGLCEGPDSLFVQSPPPPPRKRKRRAHAAESSSSEASYEPGHEYEVPPLGADAGCDPVAGGDAGAIACQMDGGAT
jgi:hypothetical protein